MKACFFANAPLDVINVVGFYQTDIRILKELGFKVQIANEWNNIPEDADLYFSYWASSGAKAVVYSKLRRKPSVVVVAGSDVAKSDPTSTGYNARPFWQKHIIKWTLKNANALVADSKEVLREAIGLGARNTYLSYFAVDEKLYRPMNVKKENMGIIVSHLSKQNVERKCLEDIITAMWYVTKKISDAKFVFIGTKLDGFPILEYLALKLGLQKNILFLESRGMPEKEKIMWLNRAKMFVQPSFHEGFGLAMVEAMSCGTPPVVTRKGATPEVAGDSAIYVPIKSPKVLAQTMIRLMKDDNFRKKMGRKARQRVLENFVYKRRKKEISDIVSRVMKK